MVKKEAAVLAAALFVLVFSKDTTPGSTGGIKTL